MQQIALVPLERVGQLKVGDTLVITDVRQKQFIAKVRRIIDPGQRGEEIILSVRKNVYFIISNYLQGTSWIKQCSVLPEVRITWLSNTTEKFDIY